MVKCTCLTVATECTWKGVQQAADGHGFSPALLRSLPLTLHWISLGHLIKDVHLLDVAGSDIPLQETKTGLSFCC